MNIFRIFQGFSQVGSNCLAQGFRCCIVAIGLPSLLTYLVRVLGDMFNVNLYHQNQIKIYKLRGGLS
jgi:hypothetical protein